MKQNKILQEMMFKAMKMEKKLLLLMEMKNQDESTNEVEAPIVDETNDEIITKKS